MQGLPNLENFYDKHDFSCRKLFSETLYFDMLDRIQSFSKLLVDMMVAFYNLCGSKLTTFSGNDIVINPFTLKVEKCPGYFSFPPTHINVSTFYTVLWFYTCRIDVNAFSYVFIHPLFN